MGMDSGVREDNAMRPLSFDEQTAFRLYHERKSERQIARELGVSLTAVHKWRVRRNLPVLTIDRVNKEPYRTKHHYKNILTFTQSKEMELFLKSISLAARKAKEFNCEIDVANFMEKWRAS